MICRLKEIADVFHPQRVNDDLLQIIGILNVFTALSPRSKVYQSAVALLRELSEGHYKRKTMNKIPRDEMTKLKRSRTAKQSGLELDETDVGAPPTKKP